MYLTKNFSLDEFTISQTAIRNRIINTTNNEVINKIKVLCVKSLQPLREKLNKPIIITSGYRSETLNSIIGGSVNSQHCKGEAADIIISGMRACELFAYILTSDILYDQVILEFNRWVHISYSQKKNRMNALLAKHVNGKIVYEIFLRSTRFEI